MNENDAAYVDEKNSPRLALSRQIFSIVCRAKEMLGNELSAFEYAEKYRSILIDVTLRGHQILEKLYENNPDSSTSQLFRALRRTERFSWVDALEIGIYGEDTTIPSVIGSFKPYELFAALALTLVDEISFDIAFPEVEKRLYIDDAGQEIVREGKFEPMPSVEDVLHAAVQVSEGMEAVCIAENLCHKNRPWARSTAIDQEVERRISEKARDAAKARHRENYEFKAETFEWCQNNRHKYKNRSEATRFIMQSKLMPLTYPTAYAYLTEWDNLHPRTP